MPPIETILAVTLAGFALSATPGPSMLYVLSRSMGQNRYAGLASALRLSLGGFFWLWPQRSALPQYLNAMSGL